MISDDGSDAERAGHVAADAGDRGPSPLDLDAGGDGRPRGGGTLALGERADMIDGLDQCAAHFAVQAIAPVAQLVRGQHQPPIPAPATNAVIGGADRGVAVGPHVEQQGSHGVAHGWIRDGAAADQGLALAHRRGVAGQDVGQVQAADGSRRVERSHARHGTIFSIGRTRMPLAPAALRRGRSPHTSSLSTTEWIAIIPA